MLKYQKQISSSDLTDLCWPTLNVEKFYLSSKFMFWSQTENNKLIFPYFIWKQNIHWSVCGLKTWQKMNHMYNSIISKQKYKLAIAESSQFSKESSHSTQKEV